MANSSPVPEGRKEIVQHFSAGIMDRPARVPEGTAEIPADQATPLPSLTELGPFRHRHPSVETLGYSRSSLRDLARMPGAPFFRHAPPVSPGWLEVRDLALGELCVRMELAQHLAETRQCVPGHCERFRPLPLRFQAKREIETGSKNLRMLRP